VFICRSRGGRIRTPRRHAWVRVAELKEYPFPAANHKFFPKLKEYLIWQAQRLFPKRLADDE
jgi:hypothetical protein